MNEIFNCLNTPMRALQVWIIEDHCITNCLSYRLHIHHLKINSSPLYSRHLKINSSPLYSHHFKISNNPTTAPSRKRRKVSNRHCCQHDVHFIGVLEQSSEIDELVSFIQILNYLNTQRAQQVWTTVILIYLHHLFL